MTRPTHSVEAVLWRAAHAMSRQNAASAHPAGPVLAGIFEAAANTARTHQGRPIAPGTLLGRIVALAEVVAVDQADTAC